MDQVLLIKKPINNCGFTLVELIISIAIISILLIAGASILSTTLVIIANEGSDTELLYQAQDAMEKITAGEITNLGSQYPLLSLNINTNKTMTMASGANTYNVVGTYYVIMETATSKIILTSFIPN